MNDQDKIAYQAEIDRLNETIKWYQGRTGITMGEAARAEIATGPLLKAAMDFAQAHINCDEVEDAYEADPMSGSEADTAEVDGMYNVTKKRLVEAYRALQSGGSVPQLAVPNGYKLVLIEPTDAMCIAAREKFSIGANYAAHIYKTMLAAAPDAAPLPELTGPSAVSIGGDRKFCRLARAWDVADDDEGDSAVKTWESLVAYIDSRLAASPSPAPAQPTEASAMEDPILVPRGLIGAACYVLRKNKPDCEALKKLRALTFAPNSAVAAPAQQKEPYTIRVMNALRALHIGDSSFEDWYSDYYEENGEGGQRDKQRCRDAYAAGMEDPAIASVIVWGAMATEGKSVETAAPGASIGDKQ